MIKPTIHIICGATASGKSALALKRAAAEGGVIINCDSQQLYSELRIITARPSVDDEAKVPHKLYGMLEGGETSDVAKWLKFARMEINWALQNGKTPFVVGGSGMYIRALMQGIAAIPDVPIEVRNQAESDLEQMGNAAFHERLAAVDPICAAKIEIGDKQRMIRAYSVWLGTAKPLSYWQKQEHNHFYTPDDFEVTHVEADREALYAKCDKRVHVMLEQGALDEVKALLENQYDTSLPIMRVIGVPELSAHLRGESSLDEAIGKMQQATRNYAKRQMTWFRNQL